MKARPMEHSNGPSIQSASGPSAKIIADSISEQGQRLVTMEVRMHRFILAEMNTHRVFSRNSASSRAIPYNKIRNRVVDDPALPIHWGAEQKGMQSGDVLDTAKIKWCERRWLIARDLAVTQADILHEFGLHKSLINRLLEPFMWHTAIITATEWANFFNQRCDPAAQPEMRVVAEAMQLAYFGSTPKPLAHGEWHLPYISQEDWDIVRFNKPLASESQLRASMKAISVARCARVSYLTHDGKRDPAEDLSLYDRLTSAGHWSPFEHVATPVMPGAADEFCGNFVGWKQFRKEFSGENRTEFLPNMPELAQTRMRMEGGLPR